MEFAGRGDTPVTAVRDARRPAGDRMGGIAGVAGRRHPRRRAGVRDADRADAAGRHRRRGVRLLPDSVDRHQRDLGLPTDSGNGALRRAASLVQSSERRPAHPGRPDRLLVRRAARSAGRLRHTGGGHLRDVDGAGFQADEGGGARARRQHRTGGLRRDGDSDSHAGQGDGTAQRHAWRDGGSPDPDPGGVRAPCPGRDRRRLARHPGYLARGRRMRARFRGRPVRHLQLHLGAAGRRGGIPAVGRRGGPAGARLAPQPHVLRTRRGGGRCGRRADPRIRPTRRASRLAGRRRQGLRALRDHHRGVRHLPDHGGQKTSRQGDGQVPLAGVGHRRAPRESRCRSPSSP